MPTHILKSKDDILYASYSTPELKQEKGVLQVYHEDLEKTIMDRELVLTQTSIRRGQHFAGCGPASIVGWHHFIPDKHNDAVLTVLNNFKP